MSGTSTANALGVVDHLFGEGSCKASKILYQSIQSNLKLASCHGLLGVYTQAVEAKKKSNNPKTWKEVTSHASPRSSSAARRSRAYT